MTLQQLQRITLESQGLLQTSPFGKGKKAVLNVLEQLGYLQIDTLSILTLSVYLVPNLFTIILPFIIIIGISITFIKLFKDREIITIFSLGMNTDSIKKPLFFFSFLIMLLSIVFNFYLSPNK